MPRGGARSNAGRKRIRPEAAPIENKDFATRVLARIGRPDTPKDRDKVQSAEDYALYLLYCGDRRIESENFSRLLDRKYGRPAQKNEDTIIFDPNAPIRVVVEHIGKKA